MKGIFICYRREDSAGYAGRLFDRLKERFGQERVFLDVAGIEPGVDFVETIDREVGSCDALVIMIGKRWLDCTDQNGQRRLDDQQDFIRLEVATALRRNIRVIPVLIQGASMPKETDLPDELKMLARRQAFEISDSHWDNDARELLRALEKVVPTSAGEAAGATTEKQTPATPRKPAGLIATIVAVVVIAVAGGAFMMKKEEPKAPGATTVITPGSVVDHAAVPDVTGKLREPALAALKEAGFLTVHEKMRGSDKPAGTVLSQQPIPGSMMMKNRAIELVVAEKQTATEKKPEPQKPAKPQPAEQLYPVPPVVKMPEKQARERIASAGFRVGTVVTAETEKYRPGTVISQSPDSGEKMKKGEAVTLQVAVTPKKQPQPDAGSSTKDPGNWVVIMNNAKLSFSFRNPRRSAKNTVKAETREIIHDQEYYKRLISIRQAKYMSTEGYERFAYHSSIVEVDCTNNRYRVLSSRDFDSYGKALGVWKESAEWQEIQAKTKYEYLSKSLCR